MELNKYQKIAMVTRLSNRHTDLLLYGSNSLAGEAGEVANIVKKYYRDTLPKYDKLYGPLAVDEHLGYNPEEYLSKESRVKIVDELGDCMWYIAFISDRLGVDLNTIAKGNLSKLKKRYNIT